MRTRQDSTFLRIQRSCLTAIIVALQLSLAASPAAAALGNECLTPRPEWIWCDDFESNRLAQYFEYDSSGGEFVRTTAAGVESSVGMRALFHPGRSGAGALHLAFGRTPGTYFRPVDAGTQNRREIYWRFYVRNQPSWTGGGGDKLSRAMILAGTNWSQAMIAHVWSGSGADRNYLMLDPASGTDLAGLLRTTAYNDFPNLRWIGAARGATPLFDSSHVGAWRCIEAHVRLNDAGQANGVFNLWIDGAVDAQRSGLNWVGAYSTFGINAVYLENYWNNTSPVVQERYLDNFVVSTQRIGCAAADPLPAAPTGFRMTN